MTASLAERAERRRPASDLDLPTVQAIMEYRRTLVALRMLEGESKVLTSESRRGEITRRVGLARQAFALAKTDLLAVLSEGAEG